MIRVKRAAAGCPRTCAPTTMSDTSSSTPPTRWRCLSTCQAELPNVRFALQLAHTMTPAPQTTPLPGVSTRTAARVLHVGLSRIRQLVGERKLKTVPHQGRDLRIDEQSLRDRLAQPRLPGRPPAER